MQRHNYLSPRITICPKNGAKSGRTTGKKRRRSHTGGFLNRYDFASAGRDTINQVGKIAPGIINKATSDINKIAQQRINQAIKTGGAYCTKNNTRSYQRNIQNTLQAVGEPWKTTISQN